jgi:hypothetical protein
MLFTKTLLTTYMLGKAIKLQLNSNLLHKIFKTKLTFFKKFCKFSGIFENYWNSSFFKLSEILFFNRLEFSKPNIKSSLWCWNTPTGIIYFTMRQCYRAYRNKLENYIINLTEHYFSGTYPETTFQACHKFQLNAKSMTQLALGVIKINIFILHNDIKFKPKFLISMSFQY